MARTPVSDETQVALFAASRRRCCVCAALHNDYSIRRGQIAHLNRDPSNSRLDNLVWLCMEHHDEFDGSTSQSKGLTLRELRFYRDELYGRLAAGSQPALQEVDFLQAYFRIIDSDLNPSHRYVDIVSKHLETLRREVNQLRDRRCWSDLLKVRERLRECFEYSGQYKAGWQFGQAYAEALRAVGQDHERRWVEVKDIGYMLILGGEHARGRAAIQSVLGELEMLPDGSSPASIAALTFYAHRYLGISFHRATHPDLAAAREAFDHAHRVAEGFPEGSTDRKALQARIQGNYGNLALDEGDSDRSITFHEQSLAAFRELGDVEHAGIANLHIAKALIRRGDAASPDPLTYLAAALSAFSQLAWLEGQGRVHEQLARHFLALARSEPDATVAGSHARRALAEAETAMGIFRHMQSERWCGLVQGLIEDTRPLARA